MKKFAEVYGYLCSGCIAVMLSYALAGAIGAVPGLWITRLMVALPITLMIMGGAACLSILIWRL